MSNVEKRYSQTEKEALALVWSCERLKLYLLGQKFTLITDHKPLETIFSSPKSRPNARIERWALRLQPFDFEIKYKSGENNPSDYLSRNPIDMYNSNKNIEDDGTENYIQFLIRHATPKALKIDDIKKATKEDEKLQIFIKWLNDPSLVPSSVKNPQLRSLVNIKNEVTQADGLLLRQNRLLIPTQLQQVCIDLAHEGHQGIVKTKSLLRSKVWFPGIDKLVENKIKNCTACQVTTKEKGKEPYNMSPLPQAPWQEVAADFCGPIKNYYYLVVFDEYSRFPVISKVSTTSATAVIPKLDEIFSTFGIPNILKTDNGSPFQSENFSLFAKYLGFHHRKITPLWPRANGEAERFMKNLKIVLQTAVVEGTNETQQLNKFLRSYRSTPHSSTQVAPHEALFGKGNTSSRLFPSIREETNWESKIKSNDFNAKLKMKNQGNKLKSISLKEIKIGDQVFVQQNQTTKLTPLYDPRYLTVVQVKGNMITAQDNNKKEICRNRSFFKKIEMKTEESKKKNKERS